MKKQIVFLEPFPTVMVYKIARLFKQRGYETISIRLLESKGLSRDFYKQAFDKIISFDISFFKLKIKNFFPILFSSIKKTKSIFSSLISILRLRPYIIIARAQPSWPCALTKIFFKRYPLIYFPYDVRSQIYSDKQTAKEVRGLSEFEIRSERFCFENADSIIHKGAPNELKFIEGRMLGSNLKIQPLQLSFHPYCSDEFIVPLNKNKLSKYDNEIHTVYIGTMGSVGAKALSRLFDYFREITNQKIHLHLYTKPNTLSKKEVNESFKKTFKDIVTSPYFHLHDSLEPKKLIKEISKYDYGIWPQDDKVKNPKYCLDLKLSVGNKLASYLEAGLPVFYSPLLKFADELMRKYKLNFYIKDLAEIKDMKKQMTSLNYQELEKKVVNAREAFNLEKNFPRLEKFIHQTVAKKTRH